MTLKHPGLKRIGDYWHYELKIDGQRCHGSTRAKDLATARRILALRRKELLADQIRKPRTPTLAALVPLWLEAHRGVHSLKHLKQVERFCRIWLLPALGSTRLDRILPEDVARIRSRMLEAGRAPITVNESLKILKLLCRYAMRIGVLRSMPFRVEFIPIQRKPRPTVPSFRLQEFFAAVDREARNPQIRVILRVMVGLGLREAEVLQMRWEWFNPGAFTYTVGKTKNRESRVLPVPTWLWACLQSMPKTLSEWVFPAVDGKPHRTQFTRKALQRVCRKLCLGNVTQHRLRATFASLHAEAGTPITEIRELLGHRDVHTTMLYVETSLEAKRRAQDTLSQKLGLA